MYYGEAEVESTTEDFCGDHWVSIVGIFSILNQQRHAHYLVLFQKWHGGLNKV
jgi:hypothetical protein